MTMMNIWWHGRSWWQWFRRWQSQLGIWHKDHDDNDEADDNEEYDTEKGMRLRNNIAMTKSMTTLAKQIIRWQWVRYDADEDN